MSMSIWNSNQVFLEKMTKCWSMNNNFTPEICNRDDGFLFWEVSVANNSTYSMFLFFV